MRMLARALILCALGLIALDAPACAQSAIATINHSRSITTGNTYQLIEGINQSRRSVTIQNNNTSTDNCFINIDGVVTASMTTASSVTVDGNAITAAKASILLQPGQAYTRYYPYVPSGTIVATCASTGDSLYVDMQ